MKNLIRQLMEHDPCVRIGRRAGGHDELVEHRFFRGMDWLQVEAKDVVAPWKPTLQQCRTFSMPTTTTTTTTTGAQRNNNNNNDNHNRNGGGGGGGAAAVAAAAAVVEGAVDDGDVETFTGNQEQFANF